MYHPPPKPLSSQAQSTLSHIALIAAVDGAPVSEFAAPSTFSSDEAAPTATALIPQPLCLNSKFSAIDILQNVDAKLAQNLTQEIPQEDSGSLDTTDPTEAQIHPINDEIDLGTYSSTERSLLTPSPNQASGCIGSTSPNTMNEINEKDPAFLRTMKALQSTDNIPNLAGRYRPYSYASPDKIGPDIPITVGGRSMTSAGCRSHSDGTKRKYSFLDMLRGRRGTSWGWHLAKLNIGRWYLYEYVRWMLYCAAGGWFLTFSAQPILLVCKSRERLKRASQIRFTRNQNCMGMI